MASTGKTQGMRFRIKPPRRAPINAAIKVRSDAGGALAAAALLRSAASSAGDTVAAAATCGQVPSTLSSARQPWPSDPSTTGITDGLLLRCAASGTRAVHTAPFHSCVQGAAVSMTSAVSGKKSNGLPRSATGRFCTDSVSAVPSICAWLAGMRPSDTLATGCGCALAAASNAALFKAVVLFTGNFSANSPSSGMHSLRHTSHAALSLISISLDSRPGLKSGETVSGTGNSTVPS